MAGPFLAVWYRKVFAQSVCVEHILEYCNMDRKREQMSQTGICSLSGRLKYLQLSV